MGKGKEMITLRELKEKAVSKQQQKLMGLALAYKRGDVPEDEVSDTVRDLAKSMSTAELEKFAGTKHKGLPDKVDEGKSSTGYELYHRDFSSAMQHAYKFAKKKYGIEVDPSEIDSKVASGPRKPSKGKTNSYRLLDKDGKKAIQVQVYGMDNGKYELNMYKESVDEGYRDKQDASYTDRYATGGKDTADMQKRRKAAIQKAADRFKKTGSYTGKKESVEERYSGKQVKMAMGIASDPRYKQGNYTGAVNKIEKIAKGLSKHPSVASYLKKMNEYLEIGTDKIRKTYAADTPGQEVVKELATGTDRAIALGAIGATAYAAKKAKDRFNPVKVAKARQDRADKRQARQDAEDQIRQQNKARRERMRDRFKSKPARRPAG